MQLRQRVEVFHLLFLGELGRQLDKQLYAVKGGCNLRFFFRSPRYSEDLDLDVGIVEKATLSRKVSRLLSARPLTLVLAAHDLATRRVSMPKQTETTQRWKIELDAGDPPTPLRTKIEFSRRGIDAGASFDPVDSTLTGQYGIPPIFVTHYGPRTAFLQKVRALANRTETQARDVFDLDLLLRAGQWPAELDIEQRRGLEKALANAMTMTFDDYLGQVRAFLADDEPSAPVDAEDWERLVLRVVTGLEGLRK